LEKKTAAQSIKDPTNGFPIGLGKHGRTSFGTHFVVKRGGNKARDAAATGATKEPGLRSYDS